MDPDQASILYAQASIQINSTQQHSVYYVCYVAASTNSSRDRIWQQFITFISCLPQSWDKSAANCTPEDVLVYCTQIPTQAQPNGRMPAPGTINAILTALSSKFQDLGRSGEWTHEHTNGNPINSHAVRRWKKGYHNERVKAGYSSIGAKEFTVQKISSVMSAMAEQYQNSTSSSSTKLLTARDGFAFSLLWHTGMRGINGCDLRSQDLWWQGPVHTDSSQRVPLLPLIYPAMQLAAGDIVAVIPQFLKNKSSINKEAIILTATMDVTMCPFQWLHRLCLCADQQQQPITTFVVPKTEGHGHKLCNAPLSRSGLHRRLDSILQQLDMHDGESMHSFRRGAAQPRQQYSTNQTTTANQYRQNRARKLLGRRQTPPTG